MAIRAMPRMARPCGSGVNGCAGRARLDGLDYDRCKRLRGVAVGEEAMLWGPELQRRSSPSGANASYELSPESDGASRGRMLTEPAGPLGDSMYQDDQPRRGCDYRDRAPGKEDALTQSMYLAMASAITGRRGYDRACAADHRAAASSRR